MNADPLNLPQIATLSNGNRVRITRADTSDVVYDLLGAATAEGEPETVIAPACGVPGGVFADLAAVVQRLNNPPAPAIPVPAEVPMWAIRAVLDLAGLTAQITAILQALPEPDRTVVNRVWEYGNFIRRASPVIGQLTAALEKTEAEVDAFFIQAAALNP
jgi:hypothetical protein